jgi:hypothetical protein
VASLKRKFPVSRHTIGELLRACLRARLVADSMLQDATLQSLKQMKPIPNIENLDLRYNSTNDYIGIVLASTIKILDSGRRLTVICVDKTFAEKWYHGRSAGFHYGWVPGNSVPGDKIAILPGCTVPVVLRPRPAGGFWIVGDVSAKEFTELEIGTELTNKWPEIEIY